MMDNAALSEMLSSKAISVLYEKPAPRFIIKLPRVVPNQKSRFESDELFRKLSSDSAVRYTAHRDLPQDQRQVHFYNHCRQSGQTEIVFLATGTSLHLVFDANQGLSSQERGCDFDKEQGKVHINSPFIMNGVCVKFRGWLDLQSLDGVGCIEYDEERAFQEFSIVRDEAARQSQRFHDKLRA